MERQKKLINGIIQGEFESDFFARRATVPLDSSIKDADRFFLCNSIISNVGKLGNREDAFLCKFNKS